MKKKSMIFSTFLLMLCVLYIVIYHMYLVDWMSRTFNTVLILRVYSIAWIIGSVSFGFIFSHLAIKEHQLFRSKFIALIMFGIVTYSVITCIFYFPLANVLLKNPRDFSVFYFLMGLISECCFR